jgi:hypothetical protein
MEPHRHLNGWEENIKVYKVVTSILHTSTGRFNLIKTKSSPCCAVFNSIAGFDDGSDTPTNYKDVLGHKNQAKW